MPAREDNPQVGKHESGLLKSANRPFGHLDLCGIIGIDLDPRLLLGRVDWGPGDRGGGCQKCCDAGGDCDANHVRTVSNSAQSLIGKVT